MNKQQEQMNILSGVRVARVSTVPFFVVTQLKNQIAEIGRSGAQVYVVCSKGAELADLEGLEGVRSIPIEIPRSISPLRDLLGVVRLFLLLRRERIQIAHSTTPKAGLLTAIASRLAGTPIRIHTFTGQPWVNLTGVKRWLTLNSDKLIALMSTRCYADSPSQRDFLISEGVVDAKKISVVGSGSLAGVDTQRFNVGNFSAKERAELRASMGIPEGAPVLLFLGRINIDKGIRELLASFAELKASGSEAHLLMVGPIDTSSGIEGAISEHEIDVLSGTHRLGYTANPEAYIAIADILCLPSYREGFGTVVIEAAAMGVPTVGTSIYGLTDAIVDGETGLLVKPKNVSELTNALSVLLGSKELRDRMGEAAMKRAKLQFDSAIVNRQQIEEYLEMMKHVERNQAK